jgi:glutamine synthetase adenylyltransferase
MSALDMFIAQGMIDRIKASQAKVNYLFLRRLECALRIISETPTNNLPKEVCDLAQLARLMSYTGNEEDKLANALLDRLRKANSANAVVLARDHWTIIAYRASLIFWRRKQE